MKGLKDFIIHRTSSFYPKMFGFLTAFYSLYLLIPGIHFIIPPYLPQYVFAITGLFVALMVYLFAYGYRQIRYVNGIWFGFIWWLNLALAFFHGSPTSPAWILPAWIALMFALGYLNQKWKL